MYIVQIYFSRVVVVNCGFDLCIGPLHGIPYGLKDIIAVPHYKTTWGSKSFKNQVLDIEAWVYKRYLSACIAHGIR